MNKMITSVLSIATVAFSACAFAATAGNLFAPNAGWMLKNESANPIATQIGSMSLTPGQRISAALARANPAANGAHVTVKHGTKFISFQDMPLIKYRLTAADTTAAMTNGVSVVLTPAERDEITASVVNTDGLPPRATSVVKTADGFRLVAR